VKGTLSAILLMAIGGVACALNPSLGRVDELDEQGKYEQARGILIVLLPQTASQSENAEVLWRLSRESLLLGDEQISIGSSNDTVMAAYRQGKRYADAAISANPKNPKGYFWKFCNMGKIALLEGAVNSLGILPELRSLLARTVELDPEDAVAFHTLGQLYAKVPGWPFSFGNIDQAVSLARKSAALLDAQIRAGTSKGIDYEPYIGLASNLHQRNWDATRRRERMREKRSKYLSATDVMERNFYFEGMVFIPNESDREEANRILEKTIAKMEFSSSPPTKLQTTELAEARTLLSGWFVGGSTASATTAEATQKARP